MHDKTKSFVDKTGVYEDLRFRLQKSKLQSKRFCFQSVGLKKKCDTFGTFCEQKR